MCLNIHVEKIVSTVNCDKSIFASKYLVVTQAICASNSYFTRAFIAICARNREKKLPEIRLQSNFHDILHGVFFFFLFAKFAYFAHVTEIYDRKCTKRKCNAILLFMLYYAEAMVTIFVIQLNLSESERRKLCKCARISIQMYSNVPLLQETSKL